MRRLKHEEVKQLVEVLETIATMNAEHVAAAHEVRDDHIYPHAFGVVKATAKCALQDVGLWKPLPAMSPAMRAAFQCLLARAVDGQGIEIEGAGRGWIALPLPGVNATTINALERRGLIESKRGYVRTLSEDWS